MEKALANKKFQNIIWDYYKKVGRDLPWRRDHSPYSVVVSEIMLQQTQVVRVLPKYENWMKLFPDFKTLAQTSTSDVLKAWQGLGYNRRGLALKRIAEIVMKEYNGVLPHDHEKLLALPCIGTNTVGSILAFTFNIPHPFIETNIRAVYIHFFFPKKRKVHDKDILPLVEKTISKNNPREWFYALMDYGVMLKKQYTNPSRRSKHHIKQSAFKGSNREIRSHILKIILHKSHVTCEEIITELRKSKIACTQSIALKNLQSLKHEGFIEQVESLYFTR